MFAVSCIGGDALPFLRVHPPAVGHPQQCSLGLRLNSDPCMPYSANLSSTGADLAKHSGCIRRELPGTRLVGAGHGCQRGWPDDLPLARYAVTVGNCRWPGHLLLARFVEVGRAPWSLWLAMVVSLPGPSAGRDRRLYRYSVRPSEASHYSEAYQVTVCLGGQCSS